jgi:hypothetical protein
VTFIQDPDGPSDFECNLFDEECPRGEKCMPWANDGSGSWNATRCSPLDPNPGQVGDPCTVEGSGVSGIDDCAQYSMCWDVDPRTNEGVCAGFCMGSRANPTCPDGLTCVISSGPLILCLAKCDPLLQDCAEGDGCYAIDGVFECSMDASGDDGDVGDACVFRSDCDPGTACSAAALVPGCASASCCAPFCDASESDASSVCDEAVPGTQCEPWYEMGRAPPGLDDVGLCTAPP